MKDFKFAYMWNCILRVIAFICITMAAICFGKVGILLFYLVPMFMGIEYKSNNESEGTDTNYD